MQKLLIGIVATLALSHIPAQAADLAMRPGLWEITTTSDLLRLAPAIPPDQMQGIQDMAKEYGVEMPQIDNGAAISKVCVTQEMSNKKSLPGLVQPELGCASKTATRTGNHLKVDFTCTGEQLNGNGTAEANLTSAETFTGQSRFSGTAQGNPVNEKADIKGKWLGASCGAVKPVASATGANKS
jgi:hypothetical protein